MQRQFIKIKANRHYTQNEVPVIDWALVSCICAAVFLTIIIIWGIGQALGL
ncbi:MAG: hypothetical protein WC231_03390 [Dehalococcoidales bacterium]